MRKILDACCMQEKEQAHAYLKEMLGFPAYYGGNLDALYDCLTELGQAELLFVHTEEAGACFARVYQVFLAAAQQNGGLHIRVVPEAETDGSKCCKM